MDGILALSGVMSYRVAYGRAKFVRLSLSKNSPCRLMLMFVAVVAAATAVSILLFFSSRLAICCWIHRWHKRNDTRLIFLYRTTS